jgi:hypothetical protein
MPTSEVQRGGIFFALGGVAGVSNPRRRRLIKEEKPPWMAATGAAAAGGARAWRPEREPVDSPRLHFNKFDDATCDGSVFIG